MRRAIEEQSQGRTWWERIRWPDDAPMPQAGARLSLRQAGREHDNVREAIVVYARPVFEPGWIDVELRPIG